MCWNVERRSRCWKQKARRQRCLVTCTSQTICQPGSYSAEELNPGVIVVRFAKGLQRFDGISEYVSASRATIRTFRTVAQLRTGSRSTQLSPLETVVPTRAVAAQVSGARTRVTRSGPPEGTLECQSPDVAVSSCCRSLCALPASRTRSRRTKPRCSASSGPTTLIHTCLTMPQACRAHRSCCCTAPSARRDSGRV
jgi:hypothetical protein